jgi:prefoldin beta subunit
MPELTQDEINLFRNLNQQYQMISVQRQRLALQKQEVESAAKELETAKGKVFFAAGNLLIEQTKDEAQERIDGQKTEVSEALEKLIVQEERVKKKLKELQEKAQGTQEDASK